MSWDILPDVAWKSAVVLGITLALLHLVKDRSAAQRAWIAHIGLFVTLALPLAVIMMPRWEVAAAPVADLAAPVQAIFESPIVQDVATPSLATISAPALPTLSETLMGLLPDTGTLVLLAWGLPALALLLVMLVAVTRLFSLRNRASVMVEQSWLGALALAQMRMNFKHGTALLVSSEISSPVSWGVMRPVILLSEASVNNRGDAEAIIAHELAHVSRLDWAGLLLGRIVTALFWFNPMAWVLARQAHQLREEAADDSVLRSNVDRIDYAALLVGAARHEARGFLLVEQYFDFACELADNFVILDRGSVVAHGDQQALRDPDVRRHLTV
jgi:bla regulator protein BlaR1